MRKIPPRPDIRSLFDGDHIDYRFLILPDFIATLVAWKEVGRTMIIDVPSLDLDETVQKLFPAGGYSMIIAIVSPPPGDRWTTASISSTVVRITSAAV